MTIGRIDVHAHLLPGVDDGCSSYEDAVQCARMLEAAGYDCAFCTPHVWPTLPQNNPATIGRKVDELQTRLVENAVSLRLLPGGEINLLWSWPAIREQPAEDIVTYALSGRWILFDFWAQTMDLCREHLKPAIRYLQSLGLRLVLAHPERVGAVQADPAAADWFIDMGVMLQMNTWCLTEPPERPTHAVAERLLRTGRYYLMGTDTHSAAGLAPRIQGVQIARQIAGDRTVEQLTVSNPQQLLA